MKETMNLKELVFCRAKAEVEAFELMKASGCCYTPREKEIQLQRFYTAYQIIEEAGLESEYEAWRRAEA